MEKSALIQVIISACVIYGFAILLTGKGWRSLGFTGSYKRPKFILYRVILYIAMMLTHHILVFLIDSAVILPTYWVIRCIGYFLAVVFGWFLMVVYVRRFHDLCIPSWFSFPWSLFVLYAWLVKAPGPSILFAVIIFFVDICLATIPGGSPVPKKKTNKHQKRA